MFELIQLFKYSALSIELQLLFLLMLEDGVKDRMEPTLALADDSTMSHP
ncbi:hypothetical protein [Sporosarcina ureae]|nr:hypothetical protein [Sporosarcina ureae]